MNTIKLIMLGLVLVCIANIAGAQTLPDFRLPAKSFFKQSSDFKDGKKVFAWYQMGCGAFADMGAPRDLQLAGLKAEMLMARSMGIDGFAVDYMGPKPEYHPYVEAMFQAAQEVSPDFKLFFVFEDIPMYNRAPASSPPPSVEPQDFVAQVEKYHNHPNYFLVDHRPFVGVYAADAGYLNAADAVKWWSDKLIGPLSDAGIKIFFVPTTMGGFASPGCSWYSHEAIARTVPGWGDVAQGQSMWQVQLSPIGGGIGTLEDYASQLHAARKTFLSAVSTHYWCGSSCSVPSWYWKPGQAMSPTCVNGSYSEHAGGQGLAAQWESIIDVQKPEWVMMVTWNDFNESYIEPIDDYKKYRNGTADAPLGWYKPQAGMDELNRYYIEWYKTGVKPAITADSIFYSYRTSSVHLKATLDPRPSVRPENGEIQDTLFITTALTAPAELRITSGAVTTKYVIPAGIHHTLAPFQPGAQDFSLWRNGVKITSVTGEPVVASIDFYDYWPTTGYVESSR